MPRSGWVGTPDGFKTPLIHLRHASVRVMILLGISGQWEQDDVEAGFVAS
jgi:hypothetical protein